MPNLLDKLDWNDTDQGSSWPPSPPELLVDMENGHDVLDFTYRYLQAHSRPPNDDEVRNVTAAIARYKGHRFVSWAILGSFLGELITAKH